MLNGFQNSFFEFVSNIKLDGIIQRLLLVGSVIFLFFKIKNSGLDAKMKSNLIRKNKKDCKDNKSKTKPDQKLFKLTPKNNKKTKK